MLLKLAILGGLLALSFAYLVGCLEFGRFEGERDAELFRNNPTNDDYKNKFHRQRLAWRGLALVLGACAACVPLLMCPFSGRLLAYLAVLALWGAAVWNGEFTPTLNLGRKLDYVDEYYVSPNADASFWDRWLTWLANYFSLLPSDLLREVLEWSKRILCTVWLIVFVYLSFTILSR